MTIGPDMNERELFVALGTEILSSSKMGAKISEQQKYSLGKNWLETHMEEIRSAVCSNNLVKDLAEKSDTTALITALAPLIAFSVTTTSISILAALVIRVGVRQICSGQWKPSA